MTRARQLVGEPKPADVNPNCGRGRACGRAKGHIRARGHISPEDMLEQLHQCLSMSLRV